MAKYDHGVKVNPLREHRSLWLRHLLLLMAFAALGLGVGCMASDEEKPPSAMSQQTASAQGADDGIVAQTEDATQQGADDGVAAPTEAAPQQAELTEEQSAPAAPDAAMFAGHQYRIHIHKASHKLELFELGQENPIRIYPVGVGKNPAEKQGEGDNATPTRWGNVEGSLVGALPTTSSSDIPFVVDDINDASSWSHDFHDGNGVIDYAYGPWFISLNTGWNGIGIHGTHDPSSVGYNVSEGCIRLHNDDVDELKRFISSDTGGIGINVIISDD